MKIIYTGRGGRRNSSMPSVEGDCIELLYNNWDDYGYETFFSTVCRIKDREYELGPIRILFAKSFVSRKILDDLLKKGWDGVFPVKGLNYISNPSEIAFYEQLVSVLPDKITKSVALMLRDASYLVHLQEDRDAQELVQTQGFSNSLQRERGSIEAFLDGWRIFEKSAITTSNLDFKFRNACGDISTLNLRFRNSQSILPHDINVLIGANGTGKSRLLLQMVEAWIAGEQDDGDVGFVVSPNVSRLIVISYSPFELFPVDLAHTKLQDKNAYKYFGFRGRASSTKITSASQVVLSRQVPRIDASNSLLSSIEDDQRYQVINNWGQKIKTIERVLRSTIAFDSMALEIEAGISNHIIYGGEVAGEAFLETRIKNLPKRYVLVNSETVLKFNIEKLSRSTKITSGVIFFRNGEIVELSSGQRLFAYLVINILGAIKRNSLVLIDEPELFLHPTLEIQLIEMLKKILHNFSSKAVLATHSIVTVREIPADCVHVMERVSDEVIIKQPPFQTFGGDVQRISSYVFGDKSVSKPFETWIRKQLDSFEGSADELISVLGAEINEEMIIQIKAMERGQW